MPLPTRVRVNVRDLWSKDESDVQKAILEVKKLIGYDLLVEPEWQILWTELHQHYDEPGGFVPDIARVFIAWTRSICDIAEDDSNGSWIEALLERLKSAQVLKILFDISDVRPSTSWVDNHNAFEICFPKQKPISKTRMCSGFHAELLKAFQKPKATTLATDPFPSSAAVEDGFTEVYVSELDALGVSTRKAGEQHVPKTPSSDVLPNVNMLERPEELMKRPPYHLILTHVQYGKSISIQCSHQPSLQLISDYFSKWTKRNHNQTTKPPAAEITMKESCFGLGLLFDRLELELNSHDYKHGLSPPLILAFVESVLGYRMTYQDASSWTFRRDIAFGE
ncbi:uncharacterized protein PV09_06138 [Verruconis gallopava]|uniref:Uncharacterized protein n=1 Tax=Verruconis gallopava TaxID=253628 RepID=A0A0D2A7Y6_9PEZI|nr:uncharacterized protein PV09_06138 [Verruconis gallopava]KIW02700.1 hypothetical protein PV09_06138 [Verruconis gallopava]